MGKPEVAYSLTEAAYNPEARAKRPGPLPHHPEGRIQFLRFETIDLLNTCECGYRRALLQYLLSATCLNSLRPDQATLRPVRSRRRAEQWVEARAA